MLKSQAIDLAQKFNTSPDYRARPAGKKWRVTQVGKAYIIVTDDYYMTDYEGRAIYARQDI